MNMETFRAYTPRDRDWVTRSNLTFYQSAHGFDATFADALDHALDHLEEKLLERTCTYVIVQGVKGPVGSIFLSRDEDAAARIRLFYLADNHRGKGIGALMLRYVIDEAGRNGFERVRVSTFDRHPEAAHLYAKFGFILVAKTPTTAFGQTMQQLDFELAISSNSNFV